MKQAKKIFCVFIDGFWQILRTPWLVITMIFLFLTAILLGTMVVPQQLTPAAYSRLYGEFLTAVLLFFELNTIFRSWFFIFTAFYLFAALLGDVASRFYSLIHGQERNFGRYALIFTEAALLMVMVGGYLEGNFAEHGYLRLDEAAYKSIFTKDLSYGLKKNISLPFALRAAKFAIITDAAGRDAAYETELEILYQGTSFKEKLELGAPITVAGFNISQASYYHDAAGRAHTIVEVASHPGKVPLALGGFLLLLGALLLALGQFRISSRQ